MASSFKATALSGMMGQEPDLANAVPQHQPLNDRQVPNNAGGYAFKVDDMARLRRFLIIGSEGGTYYITEQALTLEAARCVRALLDAGKGAEVVAEITAVSAQGRAPKQGPGVFALALCCRLGNAGTKRAAFDALPKVCRTASTLFDFVGYCKALNQEVAETEGRKVGNASWGRAMRHAVAGWYLSQRPLQLAYQVTKYTQRGGWSNRDLLRLTHPQPGFIRVQAQRQQAAQATGELEKVSLASPGGEEAEDWEMVGGADNVQSAEAAPDPAAAATALDQRVEEIQTVFRFIVEEAAPATEADGRVAAYLAAAHRLRKAQALLPPEPEPAAKAAEPPLSEAAVHAALAEAERLGKPVSEAVMAALHRLIDGDRMAKEGQQEAAGRQQQPGGAAPTQAAEPAQPQQPAGPEAAATAAATTASGAAVVEPQAAAPAAGSGQGPDGPQETAGAIAAAAEAQPASKRRRLQKPKAPVEPITVDEACELICRHRFSREHVGDMRLLRSLEVWGALLDVGMPFTALTRNLGRLTSLGAFDEARCSRAAEHLATVTKRFQDPEAMKAARAHPIVLLNALRVYSAGRGDLGSMKWKPHNEVVAALDAGFYSAFRNVQPTSRRFLLGVDVSGSMDRNKCAGMGSLTAREAAAAVAMCLLRTEGKKSVTSMAFTTQFSPLDLEEDDTLEAALRKAQCNAFGGTDCAQPMVHALRKGLKVDCFVVLTDSETWFGDIHPAEALQQYRAKTGIPARLLVLAFSGTSVTIADPEDAGMLDVPGLDAGVPEVMRQFVLGEI